MHLLWDDDPEGFYEAILTGISRINKVHLLESYYRNWRDTIEEHERRDEIIGVFKERKEELLA